MDLGALELQIFVSLVVVLGSAFVALVCDYLKGNNEQLRERNIELRVRTEEQERFAILNPSAWLSQFRGSFGGGTARAEQAAPVAAEAVMHSHAPAEGASVRGGSRSGAGAALGRRWLQWRRRRRLDSRCSGIRRGGTPARSPQTRE